MHSTARLRPAQTVFDSRRPGPAPETFGRKPAAVQPVGRMLQRPAVITPFDARHGAVPRERFVKVAGDRHWQSLDVAGAKLTDSAVAAMLASGALTEAVPPPTRRPPVAPSVPSPEPEPDDAGRYEAPSPADRRWWASHPANQHSFDVVEQRRKPRRASAAPDGPLRLTPDEQRLWHQHQAEAAERADRMRREFA